jgi:hypothetical protein
MSAGVEDTTWTRRFRHTPGRRLHPALRADMQLFLLVLELFNGRQICGSTNRRQLPFSLESDASIYGGCAVFGGHSYRVKWDTVHESADMCVLEARMVRLALERWGRYLSGSVLWVIVDNQGVADLLSGGTVRRSPELQAEFVRIIILQLKYSIFCIPQWIASELNIIPDAGSRCYETDTTVAAKYEDIFNTRLAAWRREHVMWRFCQPRVLRPEADCLWQRWCDLTDSLSPQAGAKRRFRNM